MNKQERKEFLAQPDVRASLEKARGQVAVARGQSSVLAQSEPMRRRFFKALLIAGFSGAAFLAGTPAAEATVIFENVLFAASGATAKRSEADRWADIKTVKDFGAVGNNMADDTIPIQATVNWVGTANRGVIGFPPGTYKTTASITFNFNGALSIIFRGVYGLSTIRGDFAGFILDRSLSPSDNPTGGGRVIEYLNIVNINAAGGGIRLGSSVGATIHDCTVSAWQAIWCVDADGGAVQSFTIQDCAVSSGGLGGVSNGIVVGGNGVVQGCDITGFSGAGVRVFGVGACLIGNRYEVNGTAISLGLLPDGVTTNFAKGFTIFGGSFESNVIGINFANGCIGFDVGGIIMSATEMGAAGTPQYAILVSGDKAKSGTFNGIEIAGAYQVAGISVGNSTNRNALVFNGVSVANSSTLGGVPWITPTAAHTATFINCNVLPTYLFANLPVSTNLREGDTYYITNANTATLGNAVTAGGAPNTHGYVTWNGTAWTLMSK